MEYEENDPREEILRELETLIALGLVTVTGMTDDGQWLYVLTEKAKAMSEEERWETIFGYVVDLDDEDKEE
jgi:hypothetical protein